VDLVSVMGKTVACDLQMILQWCNLEERRTVFVNFCYKSVLDGDRKCEGFVHCRLPLDLLTTFKDTRSTQQNTEVPF